MAIINGTSSNDVLDGTPDADLISGFAGNDTLNGSAGNDTLNGGAGDDAMAGGAGNDVYAVDAAGDVVTENLGEGIDQVNSAVSFTLGANLENLLLTGAGNIDGTGNGEANRITGNAGANLIDGGAGNDTLLGGAGDDTYVVAAAGDVVREGVGAGTDTLNSSVSFVLGANVENLALQGAGNLNGTGNAGANTLTGNAGNNLLNGGVGDDAMAGGAGNDVYAVDAAGDVVTENLGEGIDQVNSAVSFTLGANLENLLLTGAGNIDGTGNGEANRITGNAGANLIDGGAGNDTLLGGAGDDTYVVAEAGDAVGEGVGAGTDTVNSSVSFVLGANVENLALQGAGNLNGTGNAGANTLTGNAGNNLLNGGVGDDAMAGGAGSDLYVVDAAGDVVTENLGEGIDQVNSAVSFALGANLENLLLTGAGNIDGTGNGEANRITGNAGANLIDGGAGNDTLLGGAGDDTYVVAEAGDAVGEGVGAGTDTVNSSVSFVLGANVENLALQGAGNLNGTGNAGANTLSGNAGHNLVNSAAGAD